MITIYGYLDTTSGAGKGAQIEIDTNDIKSINCWFNSYGNPSYCLHSYNGSTVYAVDDYGFMNGINNISRTLVKRKKDLFRA
jgi:hypothetical protein